MSASRQEREEFLVRMTGLGVPLDVARKVLRYTATLQRLAEAQCNGDWPADNGERKVEECKGVPDTHGCGLYWHRSAFRMYGRGTARNPKFPLCPDCRASLAVQAALAPYGLRPEFQGDPRGAVVSIVKATVKHEDFYSGRERGLAVPA